MVSILWNGGCVSSYVSVRKDSLDAFSVRNIDQTYLKCLDNDFLLALPFPSLSSCSCAIILSLGNARLGIRHCHFLYGIAIVVGLRVRHLKSYHTWHEDFGGGNGNPQRIVVFCREQQTQSAINEHTHLALTSLASLVSKTRESGGLKCLPMCCAFE